MSDCRPVETGFGTVLESEGKNAKVGVPYKNVIGSMMCSGVNTRRDIAHVTSVLSQ
jgi:hypothetical protein